MSCSRFWSLWTNLHVVDNHSLPATRGLSLKVKPVLDTLGRTFLWIRAKDLLAFRLELVRTMLDTVGRVRAVSNAHVDTAQNEGVCYVERLGDIGLKRGRCLQCVLSMRKPPHYTSFGCRVCRVRLCKTGCFQTFNQNISFSVLFITIPCILCVLDVFTLHKNFRQNVSNPFALILLQNCTKFNSVFLGRTCKWCMNNLLSACRHASLISNCKISTQVGGTLKLSRFERYALKNL